MAFLILGCLAVAVLAGIVGTVWAGEIAHATGESSIQPDESVVVLGCAARVELRNRRGRVDASFPMATVRIARDELDVVIPVYGTYIFDRLTGSASVDSAETTVVGLRGFVVSSDVLRARVLFSPLTANPLARLCSLSVGSSDRPVPGQGYSWRAHLALRLWSDR